MNTPATSIWLDAWERAMSAPPVRRPVVLLEAWLGEDARPAAWTPGRREAGLLELRTALFGSTMESVAACPQCGGMVEFTLHAQEILQSAPAVPVDRVQVNTPCGSRAFRLPNTRDIEAAAAVPVAHRSQLLLNRCLTDSESPPEEWPEETLAAVAKAMAEADPLGDVTLSLTCADCGHGWGAPFDSGDFLWTELNEWAGRLMAEVHVLASAYGWTEPEVLALPPHRRRFYLEHLYQRS